MDLSINLIDHDIIARQLAVDGITYNIRWNADYHKEQIVVSNHDDSEVVLRLWWSNCNERWTLENSHGNDNQYDYGKDDPHYIDYIWELDQLVTWACCVE